MVRMQEHIVHASGKTKTVCVTACLTALGVPFNSFKVTGDVGKANYLSILRRHGNAVRSRKSKMKGLTIGKVRDSIRGLNDPIGTKYFVVVSGSRYCHAMVLNRTGNTIVDTDPRKRDKRKVYSIHAVYK